MGWEGPFDPGSAEDENDERWHTFAATVWVNGARGLAVELQRRETASVCTVTSRKSWRPVVPMALISGRELEVSQEDLDWTTGCRAAKRRSLESRRVVAP